MDFRYFKVTIIGSLVSLFCSSLAFAQLYDERASCESQKSALPDTGDEIRILEYPDGKRFLTHDRIEFGSPIEDRREEITLEGNLLFDSCQIKVQRKSSEDSFSFLIKNKRISSTNQYSDYKCHLSIGLRNELCRNPDEPLIWKQLSVATAKNYFGLQKLQKRISASDVYCFYSLDVKVMENALKNVPNEGENKIINIEIPYADGSLHKFQSVKTEIYQGGNPPDVNTFKGVQVDDPLVQARFEMLLHTFSAYLRGPALGQVSETDSIGIDNVFLSVQLAPSGQVPKKEYCF